MRKTILVCLSLIAVLLFLIAGCKTAEEQGEASEDSEDAALTGEARKTPSPQVVSPVQCERKCKLMKTGNDLTACIKKCNSPKPVVVTSEFNLKVNTDMIYLPDMALMVSNGEGSIIDLANACIYIEGPEGQTVPDFKVRIKTLGDAGAYDIVDIPISGQKASKSCVLLAPFFDNGMVLKFPLAELSDDYIPLYFELDYDGVIKESNEEDNAGLVIAQIVYLG